MLSSAAEEMRHKNRRLRVTVTRLRSSQTAGNATKAADLHELLAELLPADTWRDISREYSRNPELQSELHEYRSHLEELARMLPSIHARLQADKARLAKRLEQVTAAAAWAKGRADSL